MIHIRSTALTLLINDIDTSSKTCEMTLYADDSVRYVDDETCETFEKKFNSDLEQISTWLGTNNIVVNRRK